jgi:hypothetical protein
MRQMPSLMLMQCVTILLLFLVLYADNDDLQIADTYWYLHTQPRTTFTHELDMRPYVEKW